METAMRLGVLALAAVLAACRSEPSEARGVARSAAISDQVHGGGTPGFFFLPPLVKATAYGTFASGLSPEVTIEELPPGTRGTLARFSRSAGTVTESAAEEHYHVQWDTRAVSLDPALTYRIHVRLEGEPFELGFADVDVVDRGSELKSVTTGEFIPLLDGRTLPVKFRIEPGALLCMGVRCTALDACHVPGACDTRTGRCSNPIAPEATPCDDGNACTQVDRCVQGACTGSEPIACAAPDPCHEPGTCDPATGTCDDPPKADGAACDDGDLCTRVDACLAGSCVGAEPIACAALDPCHVAGTCDPATGSCSQPPAPDGTACSDGNRCTLVDACVSGLCRGTAPVVCTPSDACHVAGVCDPVVGACTQPAAPDGTACDDGDACTLADACAAGVCSGGADNCTNGGRLLTSAWAAWYTDAASHLLTGDFDGDGRADILGVDDGVQSGVWVGVSRGDRFETSLWANWDMWSTTHLLTGDFDDDGRTDLVGVFPGIPFLPDPAHQGNIWVGLSRGDHFETSLWGQWSNTSTTPVAGGDLDGDGARDDLAMLASDGTIRVALGSGDHFEIGDWGSVVTSAARMRAGDFNGDGRTDLAFARYPFLPVGTSGIAVALAQPGGGFATSDWGTWTSGLLDPALHVGDFDGDGSDDLVRMATGTPGPVTVALARGDHFDISEWGRYWLDSGMFALAGDFNADGQTDLLKSDVGRSAGVYVGLSVGTGGRRFDTRHWAEWDVVPPARALAADFDGDGRTDLVKFDPGTPGGVWVGLSRSESGPHSDVVAVPVQPGTTRYVWKQASGAFTLCSSLAETPCAPWTNHFIQSDEPDSSFCGPTAGMNVLQWMGDPLVPPWIPGVGYDVQSTRDAMYVLAGEMDTNGWSPAIDWILDVGTQPGDLRSSLAGRAPSGWHVVRGLCDESGSDGVAYLLQQLGRGNPVVILQSSGYHNLHWTVVAHSRVNPSTGGIELFTANYPVDTRAPEWASGRSFDEFMRDWSIDRVYGSGLGRDAEWLHVYPIFQPIGLKPYVYIHYERD